MAHRLTDTQNIFLFLSNLVYFKRIFVTGISLFDGFSGYVAFANLEADVIT